MLYLFVSEFLLYNEIEVVEKLVLDRVAEQDGSTLAVTLDIEFYNLACAESVMWLQTPKGGRSSVDLSPQLARKEADKGCRVSGTLNVPRGEGQIELNPNGRNGGVGGGYELKKLSAFNASHKIHVLTFGAGSGAAKAPSAWGVREAGAANSSAATLSGFNAVRSEGVYQYQYQVKIVPTVFLPLGGGSALQAREHPYSSTFYFKKTVVDLSGFGLFSRIQVPGFFLRYDESPIVIEKRERKRGFLQFVTSVCAIVGGVFAMAGLVDTVLHRTVAKKLD